ELRDVLPRLKTALEQHAQIRESEAKTRELCGQKQRLEMRLTLQDNALDQTRQKRASLQNQIDADEKSHRDLTSQRLKAEGLLAKLKEYERQEAGLARIEEQLARLPADPAAALRQAQEAHDRLAALAQAVPLLTRLQAQRDELRQARVRARE